MESEMQRAVRVFEFNLRWLESKKEYEYKQANKRFTQKLIDNGVIRSNNTYGCQLAVMFGNGTPRWYYDWISRAHTGFSYAFWQMLDAAELSHDNINSPLPIIRHKSDIPKNYKSRVAINKIFDERYKEPFPMVPVAIYYSNAGKVTFLLYEIKEDFIGKMEQQPMRLKAGYPRSVHNVYTQTELHKMKPVPNYKKVGRQNWQYGGDFPIFEIIK